jgi:ABC-type nickel/cobalt efflux system permease component RcnA
MPTTPSTTDWIQATSTIILVLITIWYAYTTWRMNRTAQEQLEGDKKPFLVTTSFKKDVLLTNASKYPIFIQEIFINGQPIAGKTFTQTSDEKLEQVRVRQLLLTGQELSLTNEFGRVQREMSEIFTGNRRIDDAPTLEIHFYYGSTGNTLHKRKFFYQENTHRTEFLILPED